MSKVYIEVIDQSAVKALIALVVTKLNHTSRGGYATDYHMRNLCNAELGPYIEFSFTKGGLLDITQTQHKPSNTSRTTYIEILESVLRDQDLPKMVKTFMTLRGTNVRVYKDHVEIDYVHLFQPDLDSIAKLQAELNKPNEEPEPIITQDRKLDDEL